MAFETDEQKGSRLILEGTYGDPSYRMIETTPEAYGITQIVWHEVREARLPERRILIRPDGSRLCFRQL